MVEKNNQQVQPGKDICLTPRVEVYKDDICYTNLYDLPATVATKDENGIIELLANVALKNVDREVVVETASAFKIGYTCYENEMNIKVTTEQNIATPTAFVLPIISPNNEVITTVSDTEITIQKPEGLVTIKSNSSIKTKEIVGKRTFNMVPGTEAIPLEVFFEKDSNELELTISVS